jgi:hypothetical protein
MVLMGMMWFGIRESIQGRLLLAGVSGSESTFH